MRPKLTFTELRPGVFNLKIEPAAFWGASEKNIEVTQVDKETIESWRDGRDLIQVMLPHWTSSQRELILTGMSDAEFKKYCGNDDDEDSDEDSAPNSAA